MTAAERVARLSRPHTYAEDRLGLKLHPKQIGVLRDLFPPPSISKTSRVAFRCSNEVGKTSRVGVCAITYALEILDAQVISTAGVWMQVTQQLVPNLKKFSHLFPKWGFNESSINIAGIDRYVGFSTRDEGFAQGFHRDNDRPLVAIIDEAAAVRDIIFDGVEDRCNPDYLLIMGSPLDPVGRFYDIETRLSKYYLHHSLNQLECLTKDGWWIDEAGVQRKIAKFGGKDHPFVQSNVFGEFSKRVENALLSLSEFNSCLASPPDWHPGHDDRHAFVDVAGGGDKNVFAVRHGNKAWIVKKWVESSEMATCGEIIALAKMLERQIGLKRHEISIDASGAGKPMADRLREMGFDLHRFTGQSAPSFDREYASAISEVWGSGAAKIRSCDIIIPDDEDFRAQILSRMLKRNSSGKFKIEPKEDMFKRGLPSPDEADALLGCMMTCTHVGSVNLLNLPAEDQRGWVERAREWEPAANELPSEGCL